MHHGRAPCASGEAIARSAAPHVLPAAAARGHCRRQAARAASQPPMIPRAALGASPFERRCSATFGHPCGHTGPRPPRSPVALRQRLAEHLRPSLCSSGMPSPRAIQSAANASTASRLPADQYLRRRPPGMDAALAGIQADLGQHCPTARMADPATGRRTAPRGDQASPHSSDGPQASRPQVGLPRVTRPWPAPPMPRDGQMRRRGSCRCH